MDSDTANTNSGGNREGKDMSQTVETLTSVHSSSSERNTLDASTLNTDRHNESCRTDVAVTSAHLADPLTAAGRCRCGRGFKATVKLDISHKPTLEDTMPHLETPSQENQEMTNRRVLNGSDEVSLRPEQLQTRELFLVNRMGNGVSDHPVIPALNRNLSSLPPYWLDNRYHENETIATNPQNSIPLNDDTQLEHQLPVPVESANLTSNCGTRVEFINSPIEDVAQMINTTIPNHNPHQISESGYAQHKQSTRSPQSLHCNGNPNQYSGNNTSLPTPKKKKKKYLSKYLVKWEKEANVRLCWLTKGRIAGKAYCLVCKRDILIEHMGKSAVKQHVRGKQHISRIIQIEENLNLIQSGRLSTLLDMSEYKIPAHENSMSDRTQKTDAALLEQEKQDQKEATIPDERHATDNCEEWTARCNCGQTEEFFQEILKVSEGEEYMQMMNDKIYYEQIVGERSGVVGKIYDNIEKYATTHQSLDSSAIAALSNRNCLSHGPSLSTEAYSHQTNSRNADHKIDIEIMNPTPYKDLVNSETTNAIHRNITSSDTDEARNTQTQYPANPPFNQSTELELRQTDVDMSLQSFYCKQEPPSQ